MDNIISFLYPRGSFRHTINNPYPNTSKGFLGFQVYMLKGWATSFLIIRSFKLRQFGYKYINLLNNWHYGKKFISFLPLMSVGAFPVPLSCCRNCCSLPKQNPTEP
jgi:hypothetical protein